MGYAVLNMKIYYEPRKEEEEKKILSRFLYDAGHQPVV